MSMKAFRDPLPQLELEDAAVEGERLLDVADFQGDVVHADEFGFGHGLFPPEDWWLL
jgi:hypothetical protein